MPHRNLALVELLKHLLTDELAVRGHLHLVQARSCAEMLERVAKAYGARAIEAAQVMEELIDLARTVKAAQRRSEELGLTDEIAFDEALEVNESAVKVLGQPTPRNIARDLVKSVLANRTIDWTIRDLVRAWLRVIVKRIPFKHGNPPDKQEQATETVLAPAALLVQEWAKRAA